MPELYNLYISCLKEEKKCYEEMFQKLEIKIKSNLKKVPFNNRDDVEQEIKLKIFEVIKNRNLVFSGFKNKEEIIKEKDEEKFKIFLKNNPNYEALITKEMSNKQFRIMNQNYINYVSSKKLSLYFEKICKTCVHNDYKKREKENTHISLNKCNKNNIEQIERVREKKEKTSEQIIEEIIEITNLNKEDQKFIKNFIKDQSILNLKEVSKKLKISPQAVSKRLKKIREKQETKKYKNTPLPIKPKKEVILPYKGEKATKKVKKNKRRLF